MPAIRATFQAVGVRIRKSSQLRALITPHFGDQRAEFSERHFTGAVLGTDSCLPTQSLERHREWVRRQSMGRSKQFFTERPLRAYPHGTVCQLLALTGQREGEIKNLRRPWVNEKEQTITLPEWLTKNSKEHTFPYGHWVAEILESIPRRNDTDLLFPCRISNERPISGWSKFKKELDDGVSGWTLHDLRRTYRSIHGQIGTPAAIAERLINHAAGVQTDVEASYDRWHYLPQMRQAVEALERHFRTLLTVER